MQNRIPIEASSAQNAIKCAQSKWHASEVVALLCNISKSAQIMLLPLGSSNTFVSQQLIIWNNSLLPAESHKDIIIYVFNCTGWIACRTYVSFHLMSLHVISHSQQFSACVFHSNFSRSCDSADTRRTLCELNGKGCGFGRQSNEDRGQPIYYRKWKSKSIVCIGAINFYCVRFAHDWLESVRFTVCTLPRNGPRKV